MNKQKSDYILFSKEITSGRHKYHLYFADRPTLNTDHPTLHRMDCIHKKDFKESGLGKLYDVSYRGNLLQSMTEAGEIEISEDIFQRLLNERNIKYKKPVVSPFSRLYTYSRYYTFEEVRQIMSLKPIRFHEYCCSGMQAFLYACSFILPCIAFVFAFFLFTGLLVPSKYGNSEHYLILPAYYFVSIPLMLYLMTLFYTLSEFFLARYEQIQKILRLKDIYRSGGIRKNYSLSVKQKSRLLFFGILFTGIYLFFWVVIILD